MTLPVPADLSRLLRRLAREERTERGALARLEARLRRFEDVDQFVNEVKSMHQPGEAPAPDATETEEGADGHG